MSNPTQNSCTLICVTGLTPQVVTECFFALAHSDAPILAAEVVILSTARGATLAQQRLAPAFAAMCGQYGWPEPTIRVEVIGTPPLDDIRTDADNDALADALARLVSAATRRSELPLVACISGGRKSMSALLALTMALYARPQDRIAHVLVNEPFETLPEFYFPTLPASDFILRDGTTISTAKAQLSLAFTPFPSFRMSLFEANEAGGASFQRAVRNAQIVLRPAQLEVCLKPLSIVLESVVLPLTGQPLAVFAWLAWRTAQRMPAVASREFIEQPHALLTELRPFLVENTSPLSLDQQRFDALWQRASNAGDLNTWYSEKLARIREALRRLGGPFLSKYGPQTANGFAKLPLPIDPECIFGCNTEVLGKLAIAG